MSYSIDYLYTIRDKFSSVINKMGNASAKFDKKTTKMQNSLGKLENKFKSTGSKVANLQTGLASLGAGVFLKSAMDESTQFIKSINMTGAVTNATAQELDLMRNKALEWGSQTQFSSTQVASAMAELGKMGNKTNEIISLMPGTMALAAAGEISMAEAANYSMGILNQFSMELGQAGEVSDILAVGASSAATSVVGLAEAMSNTGLDAKMAGLSIKDTTKALMAMATVNLEGAEAGTMMKAMLTEISVGSSKVRKGFEKMGIDMDQFRDSTTGQITDIWALVEAMKAGGANAAILGEMFGRQAKKGMGALLEADTEKLKEFDKALMDSSGASEKMANKLKEGLEPMIQFESIMGNLKVMVGTFTTTALNPLLEKFNLWMGNMQQNNPEILEMITYIAIGATALGAILIPLGLLISSLGSLIGVIKIAMGVTKLFGIGQAFLSGMFGLSGASIANTTIATNAYMVGAKIAAAATKIWAGVQMVFNAVMAGNPIAIVIIVIVALVTAIILAAKHFGGFGNLVDFIWGQMKKFGSWVAGGFTSIMTAFGNFFAGLWQNITNVAVMAWEGIKSAFTASINFIKSVFYTFADGLLSTYGNIFKTIVGLASKIGGALGLDTSGMDNTISKMTELQKSVRAKSLIGGSSIGGLDQAPIPQNNQGQNVNANASVSVYTEKNMTVEPFVASGDLGYQMQGAYQ